VKAIRSSIAVLLCLMSLLAPKMTLAAAKADLDASIETLKSEVVQLNQELFELEEQLLYPATTEFAVFVSMEAVDDFSVSSIKLNLDTEDITSYLYTAAQVEALRRGGIQKIFIGNLKPGLHKLSAQILGKDSDGRLLKRTVVADFGKARASKYLEIKISNNEKQNRPDFSIVEWK
jgi:hypothetical protein